MRDLREKVLAHIWGSACRNAGGHCRCGAVPDEERLRHRNHADSGRRQDADL